MLKTRVIPCLLYKNHSLVKTVRFANPKYLGDPINIIRIFNEKEVDELVFLDITASIEKRKPSFELISKIAGECFMPLSYGGGIRSLNDIHTILSLGVEKIIINSYAVEEPSFIEKAANLYGNQSIIVSIDVKKNIWGKYELFTYNGRNRTRIDPVKFAVQMEKMGAGEIILNSIQQDGTMEGYDLNIINIVSNSINIPVIACGGAGNLSDFTKAIKAGASAVSAGSIFVFHGIHRAVLINYPSPEELDMALK